MLNTQWLLANGLGGYASGTISGAVTWRYHGLLIAALPAPLGRVLMLNHLAESLCLPDGGTHPFGGADATDADPAHAWHFLEEFRLENHPPIWRYEIEGIVIEKRIVLLYLQNTVHVQYLLRTPVENVRLELRPSLQFRPFEGSVGTPLRQPYEVRRQGRPVGAWWRWAPALFIARASI